MQVIHTLLWGALSWKCKGTEETDTACSSKPECSSMGAGSESGWLLPPDLCDLISAMLASLPFVLPVLLCVHFHGTVTLLSMQPPDYSTDRGRSASQKEERRDIHTHNLPFCTSHLGLSLLKCVGVTCLLWTEGGGTLMCQTVGLYPPGQSRSSKTKVSLKQVCASSLLPS